MQVRLGRTGLTVNKNGFGALPIQRITKRAATALLRKAYANGVNYYDTARSYTDSEEKIGFALAGARQNIVIATKTPATTPAGFWEDLATSLRLLQTDTIDIYQFHNPAFCPLPGDGSGLYEAMLQAKQQGKIWHIGITNHRLAVAWQAIESGLYDTLQFPFNYLSGQEEHRIVAACAQQDMGFIAMKGLSGGLLQNAALVYAWMAQYPGVLPIWGVQTERELDDFLACAEAGAQPLTVAMQKQIEDDRAQLAGDFCRGCGYCMPCPAGIEIQNCARMGLLLRRSPLAGWLSETWQQKMGRIESCTGCGQCRAKCPYGLNIPALLRRNYADYKTFL